MLLKMYSNETKVPDINSHKNNKRLFLTSNKKQRSRLDNSNSQKRRNNEQARLMKIKNFPPDFFENANANFSQNEDIRKKKSIQSFWILILDHFTFFNIICNFLIIT